jgi:thiamine biosynthesis lipoprotein
MGMPVSVHVRGPAARGGPGHDGVAAGVAAVFEELRVVDRRFSTWKADSEVSRLARGELALPECHGDVREVAALCRRARDATGGWFDADLPDHDGVLRFDPTGLVKGWAVERAARRLRALPGHDFTLNAGGDVVVGCARSDTPPWLVGVEDPADVGRLLMVVPLRNGAVATSGTAARGAHIVDPFTRAPAPDRLRSVTVVGPSLLWADVHATALTARGELPEPLPDCLDGYAVITVDRRGRVTTRTGGPRVDPADPQPAHREHPGSHGTLVG